MNGKQLKNSILQWAIQGKLVPQDPNDEPASVLLERIREEKARLVKEKKIKKDKNESIIFRGDDNSHYEKFADGTVKCIDDEIPFEIPQSWCWCRFSAIYRLLTDGTHNTPKYTETGIPFISVKDMSSGKLSFSNTKFISEEEHKILSARCCPEYGDLLISKVGTTGIPLIIDTDKEFSIFVSLALIKFFPNHIDSKFLIHLINSPLVQEQVKRDTRGVGNKNWVLTAISNTLLAIPPLVEQKRIVSKIEEIMPIADKYEKSQEALDRLNTEIYDKLKKSVLQEAIKGKLVPQDTNDEPSSILLDRIKEEKAKLFKEGKLKKKDLVDSVIFKGEDNKYYEKVGKATIDIGDEIHYDIPNSWAWARLQSICKITNGFTPLRSEERFWKGGSINWFTVDDIHEQGEYITETKQRITQEATSEERIVRAGSVLLCCTASIGQCAITRIATTTNQQFNALTIKDEHRDILDDEYLFLFAKTLKDELNRLAGTTTFAFVSVKKVGNILIPIPPIIEQKRIVDIVKKSISSIMNRSVRKSLI